LRKIELFQLLASQGQHNMKFTIACQRAVIGNDIDLEIEAEIGEAMFAVICRLDGFEISTDDLRETPVVSFHRTFSQVGEARPGETHKLLVEVRGKNGDPSRFASRIWTDRT
jgi:hypothetical protein